MQAGNAQLEQQARRVHEVVRFIKAVKNTELPEEERLDAVENLSMTLVKGEPAWEKAQEICRVRGVPEVVLDLGLHGQGEEEERLPAVFSFVSQYCGWNEQNTLHVVRLPAFKQGLELALSMPKVGTQTQFWALIAVCNVLMHSLHSHPDLFPFIPKLMAIAEQDDFKNEVCITIYNFTLSEPSRQELVKQKAVDILIAELRKGVREQAHTPRVVVSAMGVANCLGNHASDLLLTDPECEFLMKLVCDCFSSSLQGKDFPAESEVFYSPWEIAMALSNLAKVDSQRAALRNTNAPSLIRDALSGRVNSDVFNTPESARSVLLWTLRALWAVSAP